MNQFSPSFKQWCKKTRKSLTLRRTRREASEKKHIHYYCFHYYFLAFFLINLNFKFFSVYFFRGFSRLWIYLCLFASSYRCSHLHPLTITHHNNNHPPDILIYTVFMRLAVSPFLFFYSSFFRFLKLVNNTRPNSTRSSSSSSSSFSQLSQLIRIKRTVK